MKKQIRNYVTSALLLLPAAVSLVALPTAAQAQPATPEINSVEVSADAGFEPGSRLSFRVLGSPRVQATLRVRGIREPIVLREFSPGVYGARYTLKKTDRVGPDSELRAALRRGNRSVSETYQLGETMARPPVVAVPPPPPPRPAEPQLRIERFGMVPIERVEPGVDLQFAVDAVPGAVVSVDLPGVENDVRLRETRPGHYEGNYTVRRGDTLNPNRPLVATLRLGDRIVTSNMAMAFGQQPQPQPQPQPAADTRPPVIVNVAPRDGEAVPFSPNLQISASFDDRGGSGVDPASVQIIVSGRNVTRDAQITPQGFSFRGPVPLPPGRHGVEVTARDRAGNAVRTGWSFDVGAAAPANIPVQVLNHGNNDPVGGGATLIQARTSPNASVAITVQAVAPFGGAVNITQNLFSQTIQADANGNFSFSFIPQIPIPGTRYEIVMVSTRGGVSHETRMSLIQR